MTIARAYIGHSERLDRDAEINLCRKAVTGLDGVRPLGDKVYGPREFDEFVRHLRPTEVAVLPRLRTLDERPTPKGRLVGATFARRVLELERGCLYIVDAVAGMRSTDAGWIDHVERTHRQVTNARAATTVEMRRRGRRKAKKHPGLAAFWKSIKGEPRYEAARRVWMDPTMTGDEALEALVAIEPELGESSRSTIERIFGYRTTGAPRTEP